MKNERPMSVSEVCELIKSTIDTTQALQGISIIGEIFRVSNSQGHFYFDLKDESTRIGCALFRGRASRCRALPSEGKTMIINGSIDFYPPYGQIKCIVSGIEDKGEGLLYARFLELKKNLEIEGLFDISKKKKISDFPKKVAVVTSKDGAALQDILNQFINRNPFVELCIVPTRVQGAGAENDISSALRLADSSRADTVILARGGGSIEELWPFNEEIVARTISSMHTPVICGVGHEIDHTIAEYVADVAATTPTQAALLCTRSAYDDLDIIKHKMSMISQFVFSILRDDHQMMLQLDLRLDKSGPKAIFERYQQKSAFLSRDLDNFFSSILKEKRSCIDAFSYKLDSLNPTSILSRGYALAYHDGTLIKSISQIEKGDTFIVQVGDGKITARVERKEE